MREFSSRLRTSRVNSNAVTDLEDGIVHGDAAAGLSGQKSAPQ